MRYRLRTLLILLAIGPPVLAGAWTKYAAWRAEQMRQEEQKFWLYAPVVDPSA